MDAFAFTLGLLIGGVCFGAVSFMIGLVMGVNQGKVSAVENAMDRMIHDAAAQFAAGGNTYEAGIHFIVTGNDDDRGGGDDEPVPEPWSRMYGEN